MAYTRVDLVRAIAENLGKLVAGQNLEDEDAAAIDDRLPSLVANANQRGFVYIGDIDNIEDEIFDPFSRWCTAKVCQKFSVPLNSIAGFENEPLRSEAEMRALTRGPFSSRDVIKFVNF